MRSLDERAWWVQERLRNGEQLCVHALYASMDAAASLYAVREYTPLHFMVELRI